MELSAFPRIHTSRTREGFVMLRWALIFLVLGLVAAALGFGGIAGASIGIAKFLFFLFIAIFVIMLVLGLTVARKATGG
jgi:uncharacterized membrane protein YtjA (UPF0391 family)